MRVFLDANVLFSASNSESAIARLIADAREQVHVVTSAVAVSEAQKNLVRKRPQWIPDFEKLVGQIEIVATIVFPLPVDLPDKDIPLLCAAIRARCDLFVTGDRRDFGALFECEVSGTTIVTPLGLG